MISRLFFVLMLLADQHASAKLNIKVRKLIASVAVSISGTFCASQAFPGAAGALGEMRYGAMADVGVGQYLVKDSKQHLRLSLPTGPAATLGSASAQSPGKQAQDAIELIRLRTEQVGFSNKVVWNGLSTDIANVQRLLTKQREGFIQQARSPAEATALLDNDILPNTDRLYNAIRKQDIDETLRLQDLVADEIATLRSLQLPEKELPFQIPEEYKDLPRLKGRATVEMKIDHKNGFKNKDGSIIKSPSFYMEVDGYHAPLTAGNFIDLVDKKFYDNSVLRAEELTVQATPKSEYIDPKTNKKRAVPLELFYKSDKEPTYGITSDDDDRPNETMALPFQAYGALGEQAFI